MKAHFVQQFLKPWTAAVSVPMIILEKTYYVLYITQFNA